MTRNTTAATQAGGRPGWIRWMAAMLMTLPTVAAHATEGVVVADTYISSAHPSNNFGSLSNLYVNSNGTTLIQFDLSSLPAGTTASQIGAASLKIFVNRINTAGLINVVPVTSPFICVGPAATIHRSAGSLREEVI